jgi:hypothetical protein
MKSIEKDNIEKSQTEKSIYWNKIRSFRIVYLVTQSVQHVIHHHITPCSVKTCPGYCELCCPWIEQSTEQPLRSRSPSPPTTHDQQRYSRRDEFERSKSDNKHETIDEKIERIRHELDSNSNSISKRDKSTETIDYYHPPPPPTLNIEKRIPYKQHYDAPKPRSRSRSASSHRSIIIYKKQYILFFYSEHHHYHVNPGVHQIKMIIHGVILIYLPIVKQH